jgi:predicted nucleic acid-binding protein
VCHLEWVTRADAENAWKIFSAYQDKGWSFTDCISRAVMERLQIDSICPADHVIDGSVIVDGIRYSRGGCHHARLVRPLPS